jgi:hypothetical protein
MSSLSRTFARASQRGDRLMEQYQVVSGVPAGPRGATKLRMRAGRRHRMAKLARLSRRVNRA